MVGGWGTTQGPTTTHHLGPGGQHRDTLDPYGVLWGGGGVNPPRGPAENLRVSPEGLDPLAPPACACIPGPPLCGSPWVSSTMPIWGLVPPRRDWVGMCTNFQLGPPKMGIFPYRGPSRGALGPGGGHPRGSSWKLVPIPTQSLRGGTSPIMGMVEDTHGDAHRGGPGLRAHAQGARGSRPPGFGLKKWGKWAPTRGPPKI